MDELKKEVDLVRIFCTLPEYSIRISVSLDSESAPQQFWTNNESNKDITMI